MLDTKYIRNNIENIKKLFKAKRCNVDLDEFIKLDNRRVSLIKEIEELKNRKNIISKEIGILKSKNKDKNDDDNVSSKLFAESYELSNKIKSIDTELSCIIDNIKAQSLSMPNIFDEIVPEGSSEEDNIVVKEWGTKPNIVNPLSHDELLSKEGTLESERAVKVSGSRFVVLRDKAATLERYLTNFMLEEHTKRGYEEFSLPILVKEESMLNSGQLPKFSEDAYKTTDGMYIIPTAEVALVNLYSKELFDSQELPKKLMAHTSCFRKESGSYGKDTKGLIRLHQFFKVELFKIVSSEDSNKELKELVLDAENILQKLGLAYRVVLKCKGDTGFTASITYDLEVWMPSQNRYREISSCSNTLSFQSKRASIKFKKDNKKEYVHLINGSGLAIGRTLAALIENNQQDGRIDMNDLIERVRSIY